jgi:D-tyrosyl-tRNA(Tyr) deacylase
VRAVVQRVLRAKVTVAGVPPGEIGPGLLVLCCVMKGDGPPQADWMADKLVHLRCFEDAAGKMNLSALELQRPILLVSQFTLAADNKKGRRPSFDRAAEPALAQELLARVRRNLESAGLLVHEGRFGAEMLVELANDGPVTLILDSEALTQVAT